MGVCLCPALLAPLHTTQWGDNASLPALGAPGPGCSELMRTAGPSCQPVSGQPSGPAGPLPTPLVSRCWCSAPGGQHLVRARLPSAFLFNRQYLLNTRAFNTGLGAGVQRSLRILQVSQGEVYTGHCRDLGGHSGAHPLDLQVPGQSPLPHLHAEVKFRNARVNTPSPIQCL